MADIIDDNQFILNDYVYPLETFYLDITSLKF